MTSQVSELCMPKRVPVDTHATGATAALSHGPPQSQSHHCKPYPRRPPTATCLANPVSPDSVVPPFAQKRRRSGQASPCCTKCPAYLHALPHPLANCSAPFRAQLWALPNASIMLCAPSRPLPTYPALSFSLCTSHPDS